MFFIHQGPRFDAFPTEAGKIIRHTQPKSSGKSKTRYRKVFGLDKYQRLSKNRRVSTEGIKTCVRRRGGIGFIGIRLSLVVPFSSPTPRLARIENQCLDNIGQNPLSEKTFKFRSCGNRSNSVKNMVLWRKLERACQIRRTSYMRLSSRL